MRQSLITTAIVLFFCTTLFGGEKINREEVVKRHTIVTSATLPKSPAQVGNGHFAFGMDITGLQTFVPFNTLSDWGWHSFPQPDSIKISDYKPVIFESHGKEISYINSSEVQKDICNYLAQNPHRFNLGRIGFIMQNKDGSMAQESDLKHSMQTIDLWTGLVTSRFEINGKLVTVKTACHPKKDIIAVEITSDLLKEGLLSVFFDFPYPATDYIQAYVGDYGQPQKHTSEISRNSGHDALIIRTMDTTQYYVKLNWQTPAAFKPDSNNPHRFILASDNSEQLSFTCQYAPQLSELISETTQGIIEQYADSWKAFWESGAAVDLSGSKDYRWMELERRIVLSQYVMRMNETGYFPPQESGLVNNTWYGRFHFEMLWWHGVHNFLWSRKELMDSCLAVYKTFLPEAKARAKSEGRSGAHWPKCTGNINREWPNNTHAYMLWQIPHPIYFAELDYRANPTKETLDKWKEIVIETANYMGDCLFYDKKREQYVMGPPVAIVSENMNPETIINPAFELCYWQYGLKTASRWLKRLNIPNNKKWNDILAKLAPIPMQDGLYLTCENMTDMWTNYTFEHPSVTGIFGMLLCENIDLKAFKNTLDKILNVWDFKDRIWGWDFPMMAMGAARSGQPALAIDILLHQAFKNQFDEHGLSRSWPFPYFPSNGGLLTAIAMMCEGWDSSEDDAPGFPKDGNWSVKYEGFAKMP